MVVALLIIPVTLGRLRLRTGAAMCALAVGSLALAARVVPEKSLERIGSIGSDIEAGYFGGRVRLWRAGLEVAQEHPLVGVGAGAFGAAIEPLFGSQTFGSERESSHNVLLAILVEDGAVGLLLFVAMVTAAMQPLRHLPPFQRRFSIVLLSALAVGSWSLHWDHRKQLWFVLGMVAVQLAHRPPSPGVGDPEERTVPDAST
jgi:O-antigen ligase